ncbi:HNH endonuclease family protein [Corynebacterium pacaense]|uniref:HNH endonuclease family protein n=1 Tax=Corynebacterium pacaense TaxID=1816684 RepID=UPI001FE80845|nr:HNH endonuclease family protein [Corynebacterium pacaense]
MVVVAAAVAAAMGIGGCSAPDAPPAPAIADPVSAVGVDVHREELNSLEIRGRAPKTGYERERFGQAWSDDVSVEYGHNGCDTRNDILRRDLWPVTIREGTHDCLVESGTLHDPYSGESIDFLRGSRTSSRVQIDHLVALADAWQKGAQSWDEQKRRDFANDPANLLAVDGPLNQQKGAGDAATWLPPDRSFRCEYARRIISVKHSYGVWVTPAEHEALGRQLDTCPE